MASFYAGAKDLKEFWETVLTRRCGFREFPQQRLPLDAYGSSNRDDRDKTYVTRAEGVPKRTYSNFVGNLYFTQITASRIGYRLFVSANEHYEPQPLPEWLIPAIAEEAL